MGYRALKRACFDGGMKEKWEVCSSVGSTWHPFPVGGHGAVDQLRSNIKTVKASFREAAVGPEMCNHGPLEGELSG